jgi:uncharacterized protein (DUF427 family)
MSEVVAYPQAIIPVGHVEPVPRRVRAVRDGEVVLDTMRALYVWEFPPYPQYYFPLDQVDPALLEAVASAATVHGEDATERPPNTVRFKWNAFDEWFEEDERIWIHPRSPYARVDALRSSRHVRVELEGTVLAETASPVVLFETGLPPRTYFDRNSVDFSRLIPSETRTGCPYKGFTSQYWSVRVGDTVHPDLAWSYEFPVANLSQIAGLVAFFDEKVDTVLDGTPLERPQTPFS